MITRRLYALISERLRQFPAVGIVGPRQAGKTTLALQCSSVYFDLEQETDRVRLDLQWTELIARNELIILDEAQCWPEVFPRLRGAIDARRKVNGRFLLLGSVSPSLMKQVAESLAGRLAVVELSPLSVAELTPEYADALWRYGGFPDGGVLDPETGVYPAWQDSYLRQMSHQDLPSWGLPSKPEQTDRLLRLTAAMHGTQLNASQLGQALGISYHTVHSNLDYLEGAFLIRRLRPYFARNFPKRLTKTPKLYWRDSGLLHHLLGLSATESPIRQLWVGASWEGWVIEQILNARQSAGEIFSAYFFRTSDGLECDLLIESGKELEVIEIKLSSSPSQADFSKLAKIAALVGATRQVLISRITDDQVVEAKDRWSMNVTAYLQRFPARQSPEPVGDVPFREITTPMLYRCLREAAGSLTDDTTISEAVLLRRATWLKSDLELIAPKGFEILPARIIETTELRIPLVEYRFFNLDHDLGRAGNPFNVEKNVNSMVGSGLDQEDLLYLSKVSEIGHTLIPGIWPYSSRLRKNLQTGTQHLDTLNEVWWLSRWHGIDSGSVDYEPVVWTDEDNLSKPSPSTIDWRFTTLGRQITIHLNVKNRRGTKGSAVFKKGVYLFGDNPERPFGKKVSGPDVINVLAITAYHSRWISKDEESSLVSAYFKGLSHKVVDAIALFVIGGEGSYERLYFPADRNLDRKDIILKALFKPADVEDHSRNGILFFPMALDDVINVE